ncbi:MAG: SpoIIE family protein phosphatase [Marmoricola sp.]
MRPIRTRRPDRVAIFVAIVFVVLTAASTAAAARADSSTERRLLQVQTRQAAAVLSTAILLIQQPLSTNLTVQETAGPGGDPAAFRRQMAAFVAPGKLFANASLWQRQGASFRRIAAVGVPDALDPHAPATSRFLRSALSSATFMVQPVTSGAKAQITRTGYAQGDATSGLVVYAERPIPANRRAPVDTDSAFADLHYAIYFGTSTTDANLSTTDEDPAALPLEGRTSRVEVPFGNTALTLVASPRRHLGAALSRSLPWILLLGGLLITVVATRTAYRLGRGRERAEENARRAAELYEQVESLYDQQRELLVQLQRAVLPHMNPRISDLEIASEYVAGATGVDIGGDWYSIIALDEDRFGFVVGDVSGHGVDAVAVMAHARFTLRAYLLDGKSPAEALEKCSHQFDISVDGHMTTALVGLGNRRTGEMVLANAGHPRPLRIGQHGTEFVTIPTGPPLGTGPSAYRSTTLWLAPGDILFGFTDGLVERRTEDIDRGMQRLVETMADARATDVEGLVAHALSSLRHEDAPDDIAVLAFRWRGGGSATPDGSSGHTSVTADEQAPSAARAFVQECLRELPYAGQPPVDEIVLVVSELVTNSVKAGASRVDLDLAVTPGALDLVVTDDADGWPTVRAATSEALGGRGLAIVETLVGTWSATSSGERGKSVRASWVHQA